MMEVLTRQHGRAVEQLLDPDRGDQRGILDQDGDDAEDGRNHHAQRLRRDHIPYHPQRGEPDRSRGIELTARHRSDTGAENFSEISPYRDRKRDGAAPERGELGVQDQGRAIVQPEDDHRFGQGAKQADIPGAEIIEETAPGKAAGAGEETDDDAEGERGKREQQREPDAGGEQRQIAPDDRRVERHLRPPS